MVVTLIAALMIAVPAKRPWRTDDREWFEMSALLEAVLLGVLVAALA